MNYKTIHEAECFLRTLRQLTSYEYPKQQNQHSWNSTNVTTFLCGGLVIGRSWHRGIRCDRGASWALGVHHRDLDLLACFAVCPDATVVVKGPCLWEFNNCWPAIKHVDRVILRAIFELFLANLYHTVHPRPERKHCISLLSQQNHPYLNICYRFDMHNWAVPYRLNFLGNW